MCCVHACVHAPLSTTSSLFYSMNRLFPQLRHTLCKWDTVLESRMTRSVTARQSSFRTSQVVRFINEQARMWHKPEQRLCVGTLFNRSTLIEQGLLRCTRLASSFRIYCRSTGATYC